MPSIRPSVFNQRERPDGGPFLLFEEAVEDDGASVDVIFTDTPPDQQVGDFPMARLLRVSPDIVRIFPLNVRQDRDDYLTSKYGHLESIEVSRRIDRPYDLPGTVEEVVELLDGLPDGFAKDYRFGLGFLWEYRAITEVFGDMDKIRLMIIHGEHEATFDPPLFMLGVRRFHDLRKEINRISARYQRDAKREKDRYAYHMLMHAADAAQFPQLKKALRPDALADATGGGRDRVELSKSDRRAAVGLVRSNLEALATSDTEALLSLKSDIEQVTLQQLIDRFRELLARDATESRWQTFLKQNPFVLSLAFSVPAIVIQDQAYVGGKRLHGRGGKVTDFLCASASTGSLAIIEIKKPTTELLAASAYRGEDVFGASPELSGTIAQVLDQRAKLLRALPALKEESQRYDIHDYGTRCIIVAGRTPSDQARRKSLELYRNAMSGVTLLTFDELLARLQEIYAALQPDAPASPTPTPPYEPLL